MKDTRRARTLYAVLAVADLGEQELNLLRQVLQTYKRICQQRAQNAEYN